MRLDASICKFNGWERQASARIAAMHSPGTGERYAAAPRVDARSLADDSIGLTIHSNLLTA